MLVLVDLEWLLQYKLPNYILVIIPKVATWNIITKWVFLITDDPHMLRKGDSWSYLRLARISKVK